MPNQTRLTTELNKGWVYATEPTTFFRGYDAFSEMLRITENCNPRELLEHYQKSVTHKIQPNDQILRYQLLRRARFQGIENEEFYRFIDDLVDRRCVTNTDERSVTFLANQGTISRADDAYAPLRKDSEKPDQESRIRRKLLRVFDRFNEQNRQRFFSSLLGEDGKGTDCFDAICSVHHQVIDNIDHWMDYPENPNWQRENRKFFGDTLVFRVSRLTFATHVKTSFSKQDPTVREYLKAHVAIKKTKEGVFWRLDYYDNGRGILNNLGHFGGFDVEKLDLRNAIVNKMSIRGNIGPEHRNGEGFSIMIDEARRESGYFSITSGGERVLFSVAHGNKLKHNPVDEFQFGTHLSIIFPG